MKTIHRAARPALGATAGLALALSGTTPASAATWELRDLQQRICVTSSAGHPGTYFLATVVGSWSTTVRIALRNLPPGATSMGGTPIAPGSNHPDPGDGSTTVNGFAQISIPPLPVGVYTPLLTASDSTQTRSVPVTVDVRERCS